MLSAAQMARMSRLLKDGLELDSAQRQRWLETLAPEDQDLLPALRRALLPQGDEASEGPRTLPDIGAVVRPDSIERGLQPGEVVGPYRLIRPLGAGGMAEVWLAERADGAFEREVALKLPTASRYREDIASRFAQERDILARLEHPNIARLYDAGISAAGLPYLAMEYVRGEALTAWCDRRRLGIRQRLKFFLQVLDAVHYAHGRQVMHRDIKPWNILVSDSGRVQLLDFGVAQLLGRPEGQADLTQRYGRALTPEYASPELARGYAVDAAADVYSLGVVLYELLCGNRPYHLETDAPMTQLEQSIADATVEPPSTQLGPAAGANRSMTQDKLARHLRGDLDAIVLKTLAKSPEDRYSSAAALGDDLRRYLNSEPVVARPDRLSYRFRKFMQRHGTIASVVAASMLLVAAMTWVLIQREGATGPQAGSAPGAASAGVTEPRPAALAAADNSIAVLPFLDLSEHHDQEYFSDGLSEELIDRLSRSPGLRVVSRTSSFSFKGKQATVAEISSTLHASHVLEGSVRKSGSALRITAQLIRVSDGAHLWSQTYERKLADVFKVQDEIAGTVATALKTALTDTAPGLATSTSAEAYNLLLQGTYFWRRNNREDSYRAIEFFQKALELDPNYALAWARLANAYFGQAEFGWTHVADGSPKARMAAERALKLTPTIALAHHTLGDLSMYFEWDWGSAREHYKHARELEPDDLRAASELAWLNGGMYGRLDERIGIENKMLASDPLDTIARIDLINDLFSVGRYEEGLASARRLILLSPSAFSVHAAMTYALVYLGRPDEALAAAQLEPDEAWRLLALPVALWALGRKADSDAALKELETKYAADLAYNIAEVHAYRGELDSAFRWLDRGYRQHDAGMLGVRVDPQLQNLRKDPRYRAVLVQMKLDEDPFGLEN